MAMKRTKGSAEPAVTKKLAASKARAESKVSAAQAKAGGRNSSGNGGSVKKPASGSSAPRRKTLGMKVPSFCLGDWSYVDVQEYLKHSDTVLIPHASLEQHGPHLPLYCDSITSTEVAKRAGEQAGILYTPTFWLGYSPQHMRAPGFGAGTITLRADTLMNVLYDIGRSLIHHGFNRLIFVNGHGSNIKVVDPVLRTLRNETGAMIVFYKPYAERYIGMLKDVLEGPVEETPGWHAGELETSQVMAHNAKLVRMDRAKTDKAHAPKWLGPAWAKNDGMPDAEFQGYQYFNFPFDHEEFTDSGVMGVPQRGTAQKGNIAFDRFATHLIDAVHELEKVKVNVHDRDWTAGKAWTP